LGNPPLPVGILGGRARELLNLLVDDQSVSREQSDHGGYNQAYEIAPGMVDILDELLCADSSSVNSQTSSLLTASVAEIKQIER